MKGGVMGNTEAATGACVELRVSRLEFQVEIDPQIKYYF
jgi:hypothetical protein